MANKPYPIGAGKSGQSPTTGIPVPSKSKSDPYPPLNPLGASAFKVKIRGSWFLVEHLAYRLFNGDKQDSENFYKWDSYGEGHTFSIAPCDPPEEELSDFVREFLERHLATGCTTAKFVSHREDDWYRDHIPPGEVAGWQ